MTHEALAQAAARKQEQCRRRALEALQILQRDRQLVTFQGVARAAGVSRSWLYSQPEIREVIKQARARTSPDSRVPPAELVSEASLKQQLRNLREENRSQRAEIRRQGERIAELLGEMRAGADLA